MKELKILIICSYQDYQHHLKYYKINTISNKRWLRWWKSHTGISLVGHLVNRHFQLSGMSMHYHVHCACATLIIMTRICCFLQNMLGSAAQKKYIHLHLLSLLLGPLRPVQEVLDNIVGSYNSWKNNNCFPQFWCKMHQFISQCNDFASYSNSIIWF